MASSRDPVKVVAQSVQVVSVVVGLAVSVLAYRDAQRDHAEAALKEARKPFLDLRQQAYLDAVRAAAVLANDKSHTADEVAKARRRFQELYVAELTMVESPAVESAMVELAQKVDPSLIPLTRAQEAALNLARTLGKSLQDSWLGRGPEAAR